jgi:segregation and condensation protein B
VAGSDAISTGAEPGRQATSTRIRYDNEGLQICGPFLLPMSLKAKLEAVIYASEEPVTLTQLAAIFAADAFEWKTEQEAASAAEAEAEATTHNVEAQPLPLLNEQFAEGDLAGPVPSPEPEVENEIPAGTTVDEESSGARVTSDAEAGESDLKREARQRDREVRTILRQILDELIADCTADGRGVEVREIAGGYRMATKPECHDAVRMFVKSLKPPLKLSLPALETLAVIAYKQPITAPEVNEIRGVDSSGVFGSLLARKLIATAGRKQVIGRPILYKTTKEFLLRFGLKDVSELPSMEEFEKMAAIELEEPEATESAVTEIGEPEPIAPEETAEAIAEDLKEELAEAAAEATEVGVIEPAAESTFEPTAEADQPAVTETEHSANPAATENASNSEE